MSLPPYVYVDRTLPTAEVVRTHLESRTLTPYGEDERLERLHRVLYPAFRVDFEYETSKGTLIGSEEKAETAFLDGLWADNDEHVGEYAGETESLTNVPTSDYDFGRDHAGLGRSLLLDFQVANERAASLLPERVADYEDQVRHGQSDAADVFLRKLRETYGLPGDFDPEGFREVTDVTRLYLPFWLAEYRSEAPEEDNAILLTFRDADVSKAEIVDHGWLSDFVSEDPTRLAEYGHEITLDRVQEQLSKDDGTDDGDRTGGRSGGTDHPAERGISPGDGTGTGDDEVVQPDDVEMDAESLVEPRVERTFGDVGGMADLKETLRHKVVRPLEDPETFAEYGIGVVNGVLLHGPPGCGKTYIAEALAGEVGHDFIEVSPADLTSKYMGEPAQKVQELFEIARANQPCLLFLDEIDAVASARDGEGMNSSEQQMVNQLLTELEASTDDDVVVMGATNLVADVDPAIRRSGRFDERVEVPPPDADARREIVDIHLAGRPTDEEIDLEPVVEATVGYAASDLELIAENAARKALREGVDIGTDHLVAAAEAADSSIPEWDGPADEDDHVEQPDGVDLEARSLVEPNPTRDFEDVGGMGDLKSRLRETVIDPLENPEDYDEYGLDVLNGLLLYGPPGCGKTHLAGALAGELGHGFLEVTPADLTSKWMGQPAQNVADLFAIAEANAPCVLFVDEIDAIAGSRTGGMNTSEQQMVNQLLAELEDVGDEVVVAAATNLVDDIDGAIRRSGRFDERVEVPPPDADARRAILRVHLRDRPVADDIDWEPVVEATDGCAASDLELLAENAARRAMREDAAIRQAHLEAAVQGTESSIADWVGAH